MNKPFNWKIFLILVVAATVGLIAIIPYSLTLAGPGALEQAAAQTRMPLPLLFVIQLAPQVLLFAVAAAIGLSFANSVGLGVPILERRLGGESVGQEIRSMLPISVILGVGAGFLIILLDVFVFMPALKVELGSAFAALSTPQAHPAAWKGFLASFYGGIDEEILLRLCVMSFLVWLGRFVGKTADGKPTTAVFWTANVLAAVLFGLGHLPTTAALIPLTPLVVLRAIVLNGLGGVAFGWLYFRRGLEAAMVSHFSADLVLHVLFAL
jgi:membrane protease YdiL (CAAX protease family)